MLRVVKTGRLVSMVQWKCPLHREQFSSKAITDVREGDEIEGFEVTQVCSVPELHLSPVIRLEHKATGAQYLHLGRSDDRNNTFAVGFRTSPRDSTGLPHILEHVTLCGSKKYPIRDPFFKMLNRSLASYMNAMTGPDYTVYPFSTPNERDFKNLLSVYLDAVFHPLLRDVDFSQEGWRLEHENIRDDKSPLVLRGVVLNEMKGAFADPQQRLMQDLLSALLPGDTYAHVSGGEPLSIPALSADDLRRFHSQCYHPSNAKIVSYGNLRLSTILKQVQQDQLSHFSRQEPVKAVPLEKRWTQPRTAHIQCVPDPLGAASNPEKQASIVLAYLCGDATNIYENSMMQMVSELLLGGPTSALHRALIEPGFGDGFASCSGFEAHTRDTFFAAGLQGVSETQFETMSDAIKLALEGVRDKGFESQHVEAILHQMELGAKTQSSSFGLHVALDLVPVWNHGGDPVEALNVGAMITRLRKQLKQEPRCLQELVDKYLCSNQHRLTITMTPSDDYESKQASSEKQLLVDKVNELNKEQRESVYKLGIALQEEQKCPTDVSCLPTLSITDLYPEPEHYDVQDKVLSNGVSLQICPQPTNGVTHFRALLDISKINSQLRSGYLPLFMAIAARMGTAKNDYRQMDRKIQLGTSGLGISNNIIEHPENTNQFMDTILLSSNCLDRNAIKMMELWKEILTESSFKDLDRLETLVRATAAELANGIAHFGHRYAMLNASSRLTLASQRREQVSGLQYIAKMKEFASAGKDEMHQVLSKLQEVANVIFSSELSCAVNVDPGNIHKEVLEHLQGTLSKLPNAGTSSMYVKNELIQSPGTISSLHHALPLPVGYLARSIATCIPYSHPNYAPLCIAAQLLTARFLHPEVREQGGAYGSGAVMNPSGIFSMFSYKDPEASRGTGHVFDRSAPWLMNPSNYKDEHIEEAKLNIFQKIDAPAAPGDRGIMRFLQSIDNDKMQSLRLALCGVKREDVLRVSTKYLDTRVNPLPVANTLINPVSKELDNNWEVVTG